MKCIELAIPDTIKPNTEVKGTITIRCPDKYDGVVINTQIQDSNELTTFKSYGTEKISQKASRLFIEKDAISKGRIEFTVEIEFVPKKAHDVRFRVSVIEQHKEIENDIVFVKFA